MRHIALLLLLYTFVCFRIAPSIIFGVRHSFSTHIISSIYSAKKTHVSISLSHYQSAKALRWTHLTAMHPATTSISQAITYVFEEHISRSWKMTNLFSQQPNQISSFPCGEVHRSNACNHADKWHKDWSTGIDDMESWYAKSRWFPPKKKSRTPRLFFKVNLPWKKTQGRLQWENII